MCLFSYQFITLLSKDYITVQHDLLYLEKLHISLSSQMFLSNNASNTIL